MDNAAYKAFATQYPSRAIPVGSVSKRYFWSSTSNLCSELVWAWKALGSNPWTCLSSSGSAVANGK